MNQRISLLLLATVFLLSQTASAQHSLLVVSAGTQENQSGSAQSPTAKMLTLSNSVSFPGELRRASGFAITQFDDVATTFPFGHNLRVDIGSGVDATYGLGFIALGAGAQYRVMLHRYDTPSVIGGTELSMLRGLGIDAVSKAVWGPRGSGFVQVKYVYYPGKTISSSNVVQDYAAQNGFGTASTQPTPLASHEITGTVGYFFGPLVARGQYLNRRFAFSSTDPNAPGTLVQRTREMSLGLGLVF